MNLRTILAAGVCAFVLGMAGCGNEDEADIRDCYVNFATACEDGDPEAALHWMSTEAVQHYDNIAQIARAGSKEQIRGLPPHSMLDVMMMRHAFSTAERGTLDGAGYIRFMVTNGLWSREDGWEELTKIKVRKSSATAVIPNESARGSGGVRIRGSRGLRVGGAVAKAIVAATDDPGGTKLDFLLEEGRWRVDFTRFLEDRGKEVALQASNEGVDLFPHMCKKLERITGKNPRYDILDKP